MRRVQKKKSDKLKLKDIPQINQHLQMPCCQVQTGEKLPHTKETNKAPTKSIIVGQIQGLQSTFWDNFQFIF